MDKRQAHIIFLWVTVILTWISACTPLNTPAPAPMATPTLSASPTPSTPTVVASTPTPAGCIEQRGQVHRVTFDSAALPQFHIYLPACYDANLETHYPVLYLLHGQGFNDDQWLRLGVAERADRVMSAEEISAYLIVMPFDKASWRNVDDDEFGEVLVNELLPYIDENYRTLPTRNKRAVGGLSRGAGWAIRYGLKRWKLFGAFGGHSAAIFYKDYSRLDDWLAEIPSNALPKIYLDIGDQDKERGSILQFVDLLTEEGVPHEWRLYTGNHDEIYWATHTEEYLRWYGEVLE
ncbi:MAG: hypothetical protein HN736_13095 [Anaerolineae bacterium]|jgi:enterochelin esterase-like enzyme|nr:hypothetical protein [Anaerolineae bacterium]MBT3714308.1 hypothetical protein [Anaerolineae bacterium]MBT4312682.1 hypothetical protein [Anaerolineae bacterium]MBT4458587.1 hypothetical protein [Anaerolineae bacterium]MBT4843359.1 hypothetical protein [Anaerolineae bacterium]